jgi:hypothetical protein
MEALVVLIPLDTIAFAGTWPVHKMQCDAMIKDAHCLPQASSHTPMTLPPIRPVGYKAK